MKSCGLFSFLFFKCLFFVTLLLVSSSIVGGVDSINDLSKDPELLAAMELFMGMSGKKREETIKGLIEAVGDDPRKRQEMEELIKMLSKMEEQEFLPSSIQQMIHDDEIAKAKKEATRQLDGMNWEDFWANQEEILEATIASGQLRPEDAARFKTDEDAWKNQLRLIFDDLTKG